MQPFRSHNNQESKSEADEREEKSPCDERGPIRKFLKMASGIDAFGDAFDTPLANSVRHALLRAIPNHLFAPCTDNFHTSKSLGLNFNGSILPCFLQCSIKNTALNSRVPWPISAAWFACVRSPFSPRCHWTHHCSIEGRSASNAGTFCRTGGNRYAIAPASRSRGMEH